MGLFYIAASIPEAGAAQDHNGIDASQVILQSIVCTSNYNALLVMILVASGRRGPTKMRTTMAKPSYERCGRQGPCGPIAKKAFVCFR